MANPLTLLKTLIFTFPIATSIGITSMPLQAQAIPEIWTSVNYTPPSGIGRPDNTEGGATRGTDFDNIFGDSVQREIKDDEGNMKLLAIVPPNQYGVTLQPYPEVFVYIGPAEQFKFTPLEVDFVVEDSDQNAIYTSSFQVETHNQVIKLGIPNQAGIAPLEVGDIYNWKLTVYDGVSFTSLPQVGGMVSRVPINPELELDLTTDWTIAKSYAQGEVWYDAIATLAEVYQENQLDQGVTIDLNNLLKSVGLNLTAENFPSSTKTATHL